MSQVSTDRRARTRQEIKQLIDDRNSVLSHYYNLAKLSDSEDIDLTTRLNMLDDFCQELVDYLAKGHFEIYRRIEEGTERRTEMTTLAATIMDRINGTTQVAVDFNDLYDSSGKIDDDAIRRLPDHLAKLGEELATRIDLEDKFIDVMLDGAQPREVDAEPA